MWNKNALTHIFNINMHMGLFRVPPVARWFRAAENSRV